MYDEHILGFWIRGALGALANCFTDTTLQNICTHPFLTQKSSFLTPFEFPFSKDRPSMLYFKGKITQHVVPAAGLEPARPTKPRDFKSLVSTIPPRGHVLGGANIAIVDAV